MKENLEFQCFICKKSISKEHSLDPCSVMVFSNIDKDELDRKSQTFFCHYNCFKRIHNDDSTLYIDSLETPRDVEKEYQSLTDNLADFLQMLDENQEQPTIWKRLLAYPSGRWVNLKDILNSNIQLMKQLEEIENSLFETLLITWTEDFSSNQRSQKNDWKVVIIATDGHYEFPVTLLIEIEKESL
jgi:hypothetical protein